MKDRWEASIKRKSKCQHGSFSCPLQLESFFQVFPLAIMRRFPKSWGYPMFIIQLVVGDYQWENPCFGVAIWVRKPAFLLLVWEAPLGRSISSKVTKLFWTALGGQGSRSAQCFSGIQTYFQTQPLAGSVIKKIKILLAHYSKPTIFFACHARATQQEPEECPSSSTPWFSQLSRSL